jgi:2-polyprenyl-3-methyl-5-hydroxy-6-metoxy-1,4-benzoquinol methylase
VPFPSDRNDFCSRDHTRIEGYTGPPINTNVNASQGDGAAIDLVAVGDLGCGPGTIAIPLSRTVAEVVAVDLDADMIAEGRPLAASQQSA